MKKYLFFLASCVFIIVACSKEEVETINNEDTQRDFKSSVISARGISNNGKWLVFDSQRSYDQTYQSLDRQVKSYDFDESRFKETEKTFDYEPVLTAFEKDLNHNSLRVKNLQEQYNLYARGLHPKEVMPSIQDYGILDDIELSFVSKDGVIQIGGDIILYRNGGVKIMTSNENIANQIIEEGSIAALKRENINEVEILHSFGGIGGGGDQAPDCTADFTQFGVTTETSDGNFLATFQWAQLLEAECVTDLELIWSWGDGTPNTTGTSGSTSHTYTEEGTYNICLEVSWTFEHDTNGETCNAGPTCQEVKISDGQLCDEELLCDGLQFLDILSPNLLTSIVLSDNNSTPGMMCPNIESIVFFLADYCADIEAEDITLTFNGEEGTPCWETCDGPRDLVLSIGGNCPVLLTVLFNEEENCDGGDYDTGWGWIEYDNGNTGLSIRQQTKSAAPSGSNKLKSKMIRKRKTWRGWARRRAWIGLEMDGTVWATQTCGCDRIFNPNEDGYSSYRRYHKSITEDDFPSSFDGLNLMFNDPDCWFTNYYSGPSKHNRPLRGSGSGCDNY